MTKQNKQLMFWIFLGVIALILLVIIIVMLRLPEDSWIKDSSGVYVQHGNPAETPADVEAQQDAMNCAYMLYSYEKQSGRELISQCLGVCGEYSVDLVHFPRTQEDNLPENQCVEYLNKETTHFIELEKDGNIVRIV
jgi:hypothetical protein